MPIYDFTIKAGATAPPLKIGIENENNSVVDITGVKNVKFSMRSTAGQVMIKTLATASVTDSVNGFIQYSWSSGDTSGYDVTEVDVEFRLTLADNTILKLPDRGYLRGLIGDALA